MKNMSDISNDLLFSLLGNSLKYKDDEISVEIINEAIIELNDALYEAINIRDKLKEK